MCKYFRFAGNPQNGGDCSDIDECDMAEYYCGKCVIAIVWVKFSFEIRTILELRIVQIWSVRFAAIAEKDSKRNRTQITARQNFAKF